MANQKQQVSHLRKSIVSAGLKRTQFGRKVRKPRSRASKTGLMYELEARIGRPLEEILLEGDVHYLTQLLEVKRATIYLWWERFGIAPVRYRGRKTERVKYQGLIGIIHGR